jgi:serine/threonine protein kinase
MLVMRKLDTNLREFLQHNHSKLSWKERIKITDDVTIALSRIHGENAVHRDLHSENILYIKYTDDWLIGNLGFCGPTADKPLGSIYGNLST